MATVLLERDFSLHGGRHSADSKIHPPPQPEFRAWSREGPPTPAPAPARPPRAWPHRAHSQLLLARQWDLGKAGVPPRIFRPTGSPGLHLSCPPCFLERA